MDLVHRPRFQSNIITKSILRTDFFLSQEQNSKSQMSHNAKFSWGQFSTAFILHFLYFFVIGPLSYIFIVEERIYHLFFNMGFVGITSRHFKQLIAYLTIYFLLAVFLLRNLQNHYGVLIEQMFFLASIILIRITIISAKYATILPQSFERYYMQRLSHKEYEKDLNGPWAKQVDELVIRELILSADRANMDSCMFQFEFFFDISEKEDEKLQDMTSKIKSFHDEMTVINGNFQFPPNIDYSLFGSRNIYHGYLIFYQLIQQTRDNGLQQFHNVNNITILAYSLQFCRILVGWFAKYLLGVPFYGSNVYESIAIVGIELTTFMIGSQNILELLNVIMDLNRTIFLLIQASYLVSTQKSAIGYDSKYTKFFPSINFLDPMSIQAWNMLRHLIYDYGAPYRHRYQCQIICYILNNIAQFVLLFTGALSKQPMFTIYTQMSNIFDILQTLCILGFAFYKIAIINEHFAIHKKLILENKLILQTFKIHKKYYFDEKLRFQPHNISYEKILERLILKFKNEEQIIQHLDTLIDTYGIILEKLEFDTWDCPYKLLGLVITKDFLVQLILAFSSIIPVVLLASLHNGQLSIV